MPGGESDNARIWRLAEFAVGRYPYSLLYGPPGTGKTALAINALRERIKGTDKRVVNMYITPETTAAEIMGSMVPNEAGGFEFRFGPLGLAMDNGWPTVINEIDDVTGDAETAVLGVMDDIDIAQYELMNGQMLVPKEGFSVTCTMNGQPEHLRPALADRLPIRLHVKQVHPGAIDRLPEDLREPARKATDINAGERRESVRPWLAYAAARDEWELSESDAAFLVWQEGSEDVLNSLKVAKDPLRGITY